MDKHKTACIAYRHRPFHVRGTCQVCDPGPVLAPLLEDEHLHAYYHAVLAGQECYVVGCWNAGRYDDGLSHWWCENHIYQCLFMRAGAARGWPRWKEQGLSAGRPAWHARCLGASRYQLMGMLMQMIDVRSRGELDAYIQEYVRNALEPRKGSSAMVALGKEGPR